MAHPKKVLPEMEVIKAFGIIAVVVIHSTSGSVAQFIASDEKAQEAYTLLYLILNKLAIFAVPLFMFISGFLLCYSYANKTFSKQLVKQYYKNRIHKILLPYLIFSFIYSIGKYNGDPLILVLQNLFKQMLTGTAHTHLYFMFVIMQLYVLFPLLLYAMQSHVIRRLIFLLGTIAQFGYIYVNKHVIVPMTWLPNIFHKTGSWFPSYIGYFTFGIWLALYGKQIISLLKPVVQKATTILLVLLWLAFGGYYVNLYYNGYVNGEWMSSNWIYTTMYVYCLLSMVALLYFSIFVGRRSASKNFKLLNNIGLCSFGIYLIHPAILYIYRLVLSTPNDALSYHLYVFGQFTSSFILSWVTTYLLMKHFRYSTVLFGSTLKQVKHTQSTNEQLRL